MSLRKQPGLGVAATALIITISLLVIAPATGGQPKRAGGRPSGGSAGRSSGGGAGRPSGGAATQQAQRTSQGSSPRATSSRRAGRPTDHPRSGPSRSAASFSAGTRVGSRRGR